MRSYIISGGSGLIGKRLGEILLKQKDEVCYLSRKTGFKGVVYKYKWDYENNQTDNHWLTQTDTVIQLAGAGITGKKWTAAYKKEIYESRIKSTRFLYETLKNEKHSVNTFIAASAIGIYGNDTSGAVSEDYPEGNTFLAKVCKDWEEEAKKMASLGIRVVIIRVGVVLSAEGGFIPEISKPIRSYYGAPLGNGTQAVSWIHIDDLCRIFIKAAEDIAMKGVYNAVAPNPVTNKQITKKLALLMHKPILLPGVPMFVLNYLFGEMADMLVADQTISCKRIEDAGFRFKFPDIDSALKDVMEYNNSVVFT